MTKTRSAFHYSFITIGLITLLTQMSPEEKSTVRIAGTLLTGRFLSVKTGE